MRNAILAGLAALAVMVAVLAALHFHPWAAGNSRSVSQPAKAVAQLGPGFVGTQRIGAWNLTCIKAKPRPAWAVAMMTPAGGHPRRIDTSSHCHLIARLVDPHSPARWTDMLFVPMGGTHILNTYWTTAAGFLSPGEWLDMKLDQADIKIRVLLCGKNNCVLVPTIRGQDLSKMTKTAGEQVLVAKHVTLLFPANAFEKASSLTIPTDGLPAAVAAMQRVEPLNSVSMH